VQQSSSPVAELPAAADRLERRMGFAAAATTNVIAMIGAGPFLTIPFLLQAMHGPQAMLGWLVGAVIAVADGLVWAELGAAMPRSGGGYQYLLEAYGPNGPGRLMSFLFLWAMVTTMPLLMASGAVGFAHYAMYLYPAMTPWQTKLLAVGVCLVSMLLIHRRIDGAGRWSFALGAVVLVAALWIVVEGLQHARLDLITVPPGAWHLSRDFFLGLGGATLYAVYDYSGYNTVCSVGGEILRPDVTIPRAIIVAIIAVAVLYISMNFTIIGVMPWQQAMQSTYVVSDFIAGLHGRAAASVMTVLILITSLASVFANMLGISRVPYAAAAQGRFFRVFARLHPDGFPSWSVRFVGITSAMLCLVGLDSLIRIVTVSWVVIGSLALVGAPTALRMARPDIRRPFRMWLYPFPSLIALAGWLFIVLTSGLIYILISVLLLGGGVGAYLWRAKRLSEWPFPAGTGSTISA
jgi:amino acid transporter